MAALSESLSQDNYESNYSFLAFANNVLHFPVGAQGITRPLMRPGFDSDTVQRTELARTKYTAIREMLRTRPYASFIASGVDVAALEWSGTGMAPRRVVSGTSDCCADPAPTPENASPHPHVCGVADGVFWRFQARGRVATPAHYVDGVAWAGTEHPHVCTALLQQHLRARSQRDGGSRRRRLEGARGAAAGVAGLPRQLSDYANLADSL